MGDQGGRPLSAAPGPEGGHRPDAERPLAEHGPAGPLFWISAAVGWGVIGYGLWGIFENSLDTRPANLARFALGGALLHDLVVAPLVLLAGVAVARAVPGRARAAVQAALVVSAVVALFSFPLVRAYGLAVDNPTSLPHNYAANLLVVLGVVWAVATAGVLLRMRPRSRPADRKPSPAR